MKNALLIFAFLSFYLSSVHASVEIRSNKLTTGDGLANNSTQFHPIYVSGQQGIYVDGNRQRIKLL